MQENNSTQVSDEVPISVPGMERFQPETVKRRVQSRIQVEILKLCDLLPRTRTAIVYTTNLNFKVVKKYLKTLIGCDFLSCENGRYMTTENGSIWFYKMDPLLLEVGE